MNYKKYLFSCGIVILLVIFSIFYACNNSKSTASLPKDNKIVKELSSNNVIDINYTYLEKNASKLNKYFDFSNFSDNIFDLVENYDAKMSKNKSGYVLEITLDKKTIQKYLSNYIKVNNDITFKISFEDEKYDTFDVEKLYYHLNKEEAIRESIASSALKEVGNTGEKYWEWYGFNHRVEWCAVFVSWIANQNDLLNSKVPKFVWVKIGVDYYKDKNLLKFPSEYTPKKGDIIFFDWNNNDVIDHVGIVVKTDKKYVYTVEGNVNYLNVQNKKYSLKSSYIYAYGQLDFSDLD